MALYISSLNSGSNGNCYYIGNETDAVLVDAGISCRETEKRMKRLGLNMRKVRAIFVTHEHADHIHGLTQIVKKFNIPAYITTPTLHEGKLKMAEHLIQPFAAYSPMAIGTLSVTAFPKLHDACDPHSFTVTDGQVKVGVFTDIGTPCKHVIHHFQQCHAAFLEANYDEEMLDNGRYPIHLKNRIRGERGHLSNAQALRLFTHHRPEYMSHLLLSHLSKHNNHPQIVEDLFRRNARNTKIVIATRYEETPVVRITKPVQLTEKKAQPDAASLQLALF